MFARESYAEVSAVTAAAARVKASAAESALAGPAGYGLTGRYAGETAQAAVQAQHAHGWVFAAIRPVAQRVAGQPIRLARRITAPSGPPPVDRLRLLKSILADRQYPPHLKSIVPELDPVRDHPFLTLMGMPNRVMTSWNLWFQVIFSLEVTGAAYLWTFSTALPDGTARWEVWPVPVSWLRPVHTGGPFSAWEMTPRSGGVPVPISFGEICMIHYGDFNDPLRRVSPLQTQSKAVAADEAMQDSHVRAMSNGVFPGVLVTIGKQQSDVTGVQAVRPKLTPQQRAEIVGTIMAMYRGSYRWNYPFILDGLVEDIKPFTRTNKEMDWLQSSKAMKSRIFQGFGVNEFMAGELQNVNRATAVVSDQQFCECVVNPKLTLISQCLTAFLLPRIDPNPALYAYIEPARPNDPEMRLNEINSLVKGGSIMRDEHRAMFGLGPLPNGAGETVVLQPGMSIVRADQMNAVAGQSTGKPPAAPAVPAPRLPAVAAAEDVLRRVDEMIRGVLR